MRAVYAAGTLNPTSPHIAPTSAMCAIMRSSSSPIRRRACARGGTEIPNALSIAWQYATACEKQLSPETDSAIITPSITGVPSKSFSVPLWV